MARKPIKKSTDALDPRMDFVALLGGLCLFLSTIEYMLPKPVPFLRIGIANLPILIGLDLLPLPSLLLVVLLKVVGQGLIGGTLFSYVFLFSAVGSFASGLTMLAVRRVLGRRVSLVGVGVLGALFSNMAQIVLARLLIFGEGAWLIAPPFLALGTVTSVLLGLFAERFCAGSRWLASMAEGTVRGARRRTRPHADPAAPREKPVGPLTAFLRENASPRMAFICGGILMICFLFQANVVARLLEMGLFFLLSVLSGRKVRVVQNLVVFLSIVVFNLFVPTGKVLLDVWGLSVTESALRSGLLKAAAMVGLIALSQFTLQTPFRLPGRLGGLLARTLFYFQRIMSGRSRIDRKNVIGSIDGLIMDVQGARDGGTVARAARRTTVKGALLLAGLVIPCLAALLVVLIHQGA